MNIIALPDLHGAIDHLQPIAEELSRADLVLLVGDLAGPCDVVAEASQVIDAVRQYNESILAVPGNWDGPQVNDYLTQQGINIRYCHIIIEQVAFIGTGVSQVSVGKTPHKVSESDFRLFLERAVSGLDSRTPKILVCHQPPIQTLTDKTWTNLHLGSKAIRDFIQDIQPLICFTGHIHEGVGIDKIGNTQVINPGPLWKGRYAYAEIINQQVASLEIRQVTNTPP